MFSVLTSKPSSKGSSNCTFKDYFILIIGVFSVGLVCFYGYSEFIDLITQLDFPAPDEKEWAFTLKGM